MRGVWASGIRGRNRPDGPQRTRPTSATGERQSHAPAAGPPFVAVELAPEGSEKCLAGSLCNASTKHNQFGIQHVNEGCHCRPEALHGFVPEMGGLPHTGLGRAEELPGVGVPVLGAAGQVPLPQKKVEASGSVKGVLLAVGLERNMPQMAGAADAALQKSAAADDRTTDGGAKREHDDIPATACSPRPGLAEQGGVRIVQDADLSVQKRGPVQVFESGHSSGHPVDATSARMGDTRGTEADRQGAEAGHFLQRVDHLAHSVSEDRTVFSKCAILSGFTQSVHEPAAGVFHQGYFDSSASEVDSDYQALGLLHGFVSGGVAGVNRFAIGLLTKKPYNKAATTAIAAPVQSAGAKLLVFSTINPVKAGARVPPQ